MKVLLTGAAGLIGSWIGEALLKGGHSVMAVDDLSGGSMDNFHVLESAQPPGTHLNVYPAPCEYVKKSDILDFGVDTVVHCAANAREGASQFQPFSVTRRNMFSFSAIVSNAIAAGVKRYCIFSSMSIYGTGTKPPPFDEDQEPMPEDVYAVNKWAMEKCMGILASVHNLQYVILRPHNVTGPRQALFDRFRNVAGIWMNKIMRGECLPVFGDGEQTRAFSYIEDSLPAMMRAITDIESVNGHAINVGGIVPITLNELCSVVCNEMGVGEDYPRIYLPSRPCEVKHAHSTYAKSQALLGYSEEIGWREGIRRMAEWAKAQGPQEWRDTEFLEIITDKTPSAWVPGGLGNQ